MQAIEREVIANDWITLAFVFAFILIGALKSLDAQKLKGYFFSFFNKGFIELEAEENTSFFTPFHIVIILFSTTIMSLFFYFLLEQNTLNFKYDYTLFLKILTFLFLLSLGRWMLEFLIGKLFEIETKIRLFLFFKYSYLHVISVSLFIVLMIYVYSYRNYAILWIAFILLAFTRAVLLFTNNKKLIVSKLFYFILYICAFEIAPLFILIKSVF